MSVVSGILGADAQEDAAEEAADAQVDSAEISADAMLQMWEQAQADFAPYLSEGQQGLVGLRQQMPQYMESVLAPLYNEVMRYSLSSLPDPQGNMVNPVTGAVEPSRQPTYNQPDPNAGLTQFSPQSSGEAPRRSSGEAPRLFRPMEGGQRFGVGGMPGDSPDQHNALAAEDLTEESQTEARFQTQNLFQHRPTSMPNAMVPRENTVSTPSQNQLEQGGVLSPNVPIFQRGLNPEDSRFGVQNRGQYAPDVPIVQRDLDFAFDPNDPTYKIKEKMKMEEINAFLAKQGLAGSTAGQSYMQRELDRFRAEEEGRQYNRALTERNYLTQTDIDRYNLEKGRGDTMFGRDYQAATDLYGRAATERNYFTQTDVDRYNMQAQRGDTLFNRMQGQQDQIYNRNMANALTTDQRNLGLLRDRYGMGQNIYGLAYGANLDLAKMGAGAAGSAGQSSITTGQGIGNTHLYAGDAQAQAALAAGQAQAGMYQNIGNTGANAFSAYLNRPQQGSNAQQGSYDYSGFYSDPNQYSDWEMTGEANSSWGGD